MEGDDYVHFSDREMKLREVTWGPTACEWQCQRSDPGLSNSIPTPGVGTEMKRCHREDVTSAWQTFDKQLHLNPFRTGLDPGPGVKRMLFSQTGFKRCTGGKQEEAAAAQGEVSQHPNIRLPASVAGLEHVLFPGALPWRKTANEVHPGWVHSTQLLLPTTFALGMLRADEESTAGRNYPHPLPVRDRLRKYRLHRAEGQGGDYVRSEPGSPKIQDRWKHGGIKRGRWCHSPLSALKKAPAAAERGAASSERSGSACWPHESGVCTV